MMTETDESLFTVQSDARVVTWTKERSSIQYHRVDVVCSRRGVTGCPAPGPGRARSSIGAKLLPLEHFPSTAAFANRCYNHHNGESTRIFSLAILRSQTLCIRRGRSSDFGQTCPWDMARLVRKPSVSTSSLSLNFVA